MGKRVLFRCDSGGVAGFGHFSRCLNLARTLLDVDPTVHVAFWGEHDEFARAQLLRHDLERLTLPLAGYAAPDVSATLAGAVAFDILVIDSYQAEQTYLDALKNQQFRLVIFDDAGQYDLSGADLSVSFRAGVHASQYRAKRNALGLAYLVVKPELRALRLRNLAAPAAVIREILLFMTGTPIDDALLAHLVPALALPGTCVTYLTRDGQPIADINTGKAQRAVPDIEALYARADLVVSGGGLVKYESAYCGIPNACLSITPLQDADTRAMAAHNLTLDLGPVTEFEPARVHAALARFVATPRAIDTQMQAFRDMLRTDSPTHLANAILSP